MKVFSNIMGTHSSVCIKSGLDSWLYALFLFLIVFLSLPDLDSYSFKKKKEVGYPTVVPVGDDESWSGKQAETCEPVQLRSTFRSERRNLLKS